MSMVNGNCSDRGLVDLFATILFGWQFEDAYVRDGKPVGGTFERDFDKLKVCYKGKSSTRYFGYTLMACRSITRTSGQQRSRQKSEGAN